LLRWPGGGTWRCGWSALGSCRRAPLRCGRSASSNLYVSLESELVAELPHPVDDDGPAEPAHVLLILLDVSRVDEVFLLLLAEDLQQFALGVGVDYLLKVLELLEILEVVLLLRFADLIGEIELSSVLLLLDHRLLLRWFKLQLLCAGEVVIEGVG
jgi:hypothetical protein